MVEPFNIVGRPAEIFTKEEAVKILKDNSYYVFLAAAILLGISIFMGPKDMGISQVFLIGFGVLYCVLGVCIRFLKSRIASLLALASFGLVFIARTLENDIAGALIFTSIFLTASYCAVKASFFIIR